MKNNSNIIGRRGETEARNYLIERGYEIIASNWRFKKLEIDLIAKIDQTIVFVEVKTRKTNLYGEPELFVGKKKQKLLLSAANEFITQNSLNLEARFDIVAITNFKEKITHIESAFVPTFKSI